MKKGREIPITPAVLEWAIVESGFEVEVLADRVGVTPEEIQDWVSDEAKPTTTAFHKLATVLKRPEAIFFLPTAPASTTPNVQFRRAPGVEDRRPSPDELLRVREAQRLQAGLTWVLDELGHSQPKIPRADASRANSSAVAASVRAVLGVSFEDQLALGTPAQAQNRWREAVEDAGICVMFLPMGRSSVRGFSINDPIVPVIAVNTHWNYEARIFTLFHELGHIVTKTDSLCAGSGISVRGGDKVERWCEEFAAELLIPQVEATELLDSITRDRVTDLQPASKLARKLKVSLRATVIWLIKQRRADSEIYDLIRANIDAKSRGGQPADEPRRRPHTRVGEYGKRTARLFLEGMDRDAITRHDAISYLDIADSDISKLRELAIR